MSERLKNAAIVTSATFIAYEASKFAFSFKSRKKILERDGNACAICGATDHLEAAHINHTRNGNYDKPSNGRTLCRPHHYVDHVNGAHNGLSREGNKWAAGQIWDRMTDEEQSRAVGIIYFNDE